MIMRLALLALAVWWNLFTATPVSGRQADQDGRFGTAGDSLTLEALIVDVLASNPALRAANELALASGYRVDEASTLQDPRLQLGMTNFSIPGFRTDMPNSMAPSVSLSQVLPFPGKLSLRGDIAAGDRDQAQATADEYSWMLRAGAADLFYQIYAVDRRSEVLTETLALLQQTQTVARARYTAGEGRQADVLRVDVEVARMEADLRSLAASRLALSASLNGLLDRPSDSAIAPPLIRPYSAALPDTRTLTEMGWTHRPALIRMRSRVEQAQDRSALADKGLWPDFVVSLSYGQRGSDAGTQRMGSTSVGFSLPVHASQRQNAAKSEAAVRVRSAASELANSRAALAGEVVLIVAEVERTRSLMRLYEARILPEAATTVQSAFAAYRVGQSDFTSLLQTQLNQNRFRIEFYQLQADHGKAIARLESTIGRPLNTEETDVSEETR